MNKCYFGRSEMDAPDIDGKVYFMSEKSYTPGEFVTLSIYVVTCNIDDEGNITMINATTNKNLLKPDKKHEAKKTNKKRKVRWSQKLC